MQENSSPRHPVKLHTDHRPTVASKPPFDSAAPETEFAQFTAAPRRTSYLRVGMICFVLTVGLGLVLLSAFQTKNGSSNGLGQTIGQGLLGGGLPPTHELVGAEKGTEGAEGLETYGESVRETAEPSLESDTVPISPETESVASDPIGADTAAVTDQESSEESVTLSDETASEPETAPPVPEGCYPFVSVDMSGQERGVGYITGNAEDIPGSLPADGLWREDMPPTVLIVNTHPYEGYGGEGAWYDPSTGSLAVTNSPNAGNGTVALGALLTRSLRDRGIAVIHVRIAVSAEDTAAEIYERTETVIRHYCRIYTDVGLVINLRRSAELTSDGGILRTAGSYRGETCAQARISVNGGRSRAATGRDLAVALALREGLWALEPSLSRPVCVKSGGGLIADLSDICVLTVEAGSAGNTYAESKRLTEPLSAVLEELLLHNG